MGGVRTPGVVSARRAGCLRVHCQKGAGREPVAAAASRLRISAFGNEAAQLSRGPPGNGKRLQFSLAAVTEEKRASLKKAAQELSLRHKGGGGSMELSWQSDSAELGFAVQNLVRSVVAAENSGIEGSEAAAQVVAAVNGVRQAGAFLRGDEPLVEQPSPGWGPLSEMFCIDDSVNYLEAAARELLSVSKAVPRIVVASGAMHALSVLMASSDCGQTLRHSYAAEATRALFIAEPVAAPQCFVAAEGIPALAKVLGSTDADSAAHVKDVVLDLLYILLLASGQPPKVRGRRAARALCAGVAPVLLQLMQQSSGHHPVGTADGSRPPATGPADVLGLIIQAPECADLIIQHRVVAGLVAIVNDLSVDPTTRSQALKLLGCVACTGDQSLHRAVAVTAAWPLARVLGHGTEEEVEAAETTILEVAGSPTGAKYLQQAGLVAAITAPFSDAQAVRSQREMQRGIRLTACLVSCHDAIDGLMQPAMMDMFNYFLATGSSQTKLSACNTLAALLGECGGTTASRARRLIPRLVTSLRSAEDRQLRMAAAACLERLSKERGLKEVIVSSGGTGAVLYLLADASDEFTCSHGLALIQSLSIGYPMFAKDLIRRGAVELVVPLLASNLGLQAVAALACISTSFDISAYLIVHGALEPLSVLVQQQHRQASASGLPFDAGSQEQRRRLETLHVLMRMNYEHRRRGSTDDMRSQQDTWRHKFLAGYLLARTLTAPQAEGNVPESVCNAIPALVGMLSDAKKEDAYAPTYAVDYLVFSQRLRKAQYSKKTLSEIPRAALAALVRHFPGCRWAILESMALRTWQGHREGDPWLDDVLQEP